MGKYKDLTHQKFGRLTVKYECGRNKYGQVLWYCECDCGGNTIVMTSYLTSGDTKSCGCLKKEVLRKIHKKYNIYNLTGEYGIGYIEENIIFYFDLEDYDKIKDYCWRLNDKGYVVANKLYKNGTIRLSRLIMNVNNKKVVDHISGDKLDNRKINLRICGQDKNCANASLRTNNTSGVTGVSWSSRNEKWRARIKINYREILLGYFDNFEDAVQARKQAEEELFGEYSYNNSQKYAKQYKIKI